MAKPKRKYKRRPKCHPHCKRGRHVFTTEERVRGYHNAIDKIIATYPLNWVCKHGAHFSHCFLRAKNPIFFEVRKLTQKVEALKQRDNHNNERLTRIESELTKLRNKHE
jgi:hypothetical protein